MTSQRLWTGLVAGGMLALIGWVVTDGVVGQVIQIGGGLQPAGGPNGMPVAKDANGVGSSLASQLSSVKIIEKSELRQAINVARDCVRDKAWEEGVTVLQSLLDNKEDHYVQVRDRDAHGREMLRWTSVKFEANNLLGSMPAAGLEVYESRFGGKAKDKLDDAKTRGDRELLAEVAQRYQYTRAGIEANELLATLFLARGQNFIAALRFEKLLAMDAERTKLSDMTLYKAALAFRRAGDVKTSEAIWVKLDASLKTKGNGLRVGEELINVATLKQVLDQDAAGERVNPYEWAMIRGNLTNTAQATGSPPLLDAVLWQRKLLLDRREEPGKDPKDFKLVGSDEHLAKQRIDQAIDLMRKANLPVMSGSFPIATKGLLIYRTHSGIRAVATKEVQAAQGRVYKPGEIVWSSIEFYAGLANLLDQNKDTTSIVNQWIVGGGQPNPNFPQPFPGNMQGYYFNPNMPGMAGALFENSTIGTLSTDNQLVYAIDDLAVPPPHGYNPYMNQTNNMGEVRKYATHNMLNAFNIDKGGKIEWFLGDKDDPLFSESHFLGAPISVGGKLYVLNEKNPAGNQPLGEAELRLVCIDPSKRVGPHPAIVHPPQLLGMVQPQNRVAFDVSRRLNAVHLAFGEGILVCPTNAGEVFGVDLMSRALVWSYPYRETTHVSPFQSNQFNQFQPFPPGMRNPSMGTGAATFANWKSAPPAVVDGKVVFTAPDAGSVHCINLRDGTPVWKSLQSDGDLFMAGVFNGKVLIVGKTSIRALSLQTGARLWMVPTNDMPSGQGVASKNIYYLPLSKGEILAVDIERGVLKAHNRAAGAAAKVAPGNLVFYEGCVLSLTPTDLIAYPQLATRLDEATVALKADPENLEKLTNHGELLLKDGQVQAAVNDLEKVVATNVASAVGERAKDRLYEALTDLLQVSFNDSSDKYLDVYTKLCAAPTDNQEKQVRQAKLFRIVGQGREAQGNLVEAFKMYKDFGALPIHNQAGGIAALDDPTHKVPTNVWLRGRVAAMIARATPEQRAPLETKIREEWKDVLAKKDLDAIRSFVGMFDVPFAVGREARLHFADTIIARNDKPAFLEAEMNLEQLLTPGFRVDPAIGGRALAGLAALEEKKGTADSMKLAAAYYRELGRTFAKAEVRKGKTGADLFNDLAADKRFLPYLEEAGSSWGNVKIAGRRVLGQMGYTGGFHFGLTPAGDRTPFAMQHRVTFDTNPSNTQIRLVDVTTGKDRWSQNLGQVAGNFALNNIFAALYSQNFNNIPYNPKARHRVFHVKGHLIVCQVGITAYCIDGDNGKVLWRHPLLDGIANQPNQPNQQQVQPQGADADGNPEFAFFNPQFGRWDRHFTIGQIGAVEASYVALLTQHGLIVNDPLRGTLLWKQMDVRQGTRIFGDEEYIFLVEAGEGGGLGGGRVLRAVDGVVLDKIVDFGPIYQHRVVVSGRRILAAIPGKKSLTLRLYDIITGKDIWAKEFDAASTVLTSDDPAFTGVIDAKGIVAVLDAATGKEIVAGNAVQGRITAADVKNLRAPLLLADADRFYVALNRADDGKGVASQLHSNFSNGVRCLPVNGYVAAFQRKDGSKKVAGQPKAFKKGDMAWHSQAPLHNQMVILEQFEQLPVLLFSSRSLESFNGGMGQRWQSGTVSLDRRTGKFIYDSSLETGAFPNNNNGVAQFYAFIVDHRVGTINMIGYNNVIQHYIDDGRKLPQTTGLGNPIGPGPGFGNPNGNLGPFAQPGVGFAPGVLLPPIGNRIMRRPVQGNIIPQIEIRKDK
jgi:outer membrane protein assembly factor BamB